jgi:hypothetical protein
VVLAECRHAGAEVEFPVQARVHRGHVVALEMVVDVDLPVRTHRVAAGGDVVHALERAAARRVLHRGEVIDERRRRRIEVREHEVGPALDAHRFQVERVRVRGAVPAATEQHAAFVAQPVRIGVMVASLVRA